MHPIWDFWVRFTHWAFVALVATSWISFELGKMDIHQYSGYSILTLLLFRLTWGFFGSRHARFSDFVRGPKAALEYLHNKQETVGHNPMGGWSVLTLMLLLGLQGVTGLFSTDDVVFDGPFFGAVSSRLADTLTTIHKTNFYVLLGFIGLHLLAVLTYQFGKGQKLINAMITGYKPGVSGKSAAVPFWRGLLLLALCAALFGGIIALAPEPSASYF